MMPEKLLFNRYTREECGLPPAAADAFGDRLWTGKTLALLLALAACAWLAGRMYADRRELWARSLPTLVAQAGGDAEKRSALLERGSMYAAALPDRPRVRRDLAFALMTAAEYAPRRAGYAGNALALLRDAEPAADETPLETLARELALSGLHEEAGEYGESFAALDRAEEALSQFSDSNNGGGAEENAKGGGNGAADKLARSFRLLLVNAQAYTLATAGKEDGGDARRALELARLAVSSRDELPGGGFASASAAFVDTLAMARFKNGLGEEAVAAQRLALGLAESRGLEVYLKHFDMFSTTASKGEPHE